MVSCRFSVKSTQRLLVSRYSPKSDAPNTPPPGLRRPEQRPQRRADANTRRAPPRPASVSAGAAEVWPEIAYTLALRNGYKLWFLWWFVWNDYKWWLIIWDYTFHLFLIDHLGKVYHLATKHGDGKSPFNGGFNWKITDQWSIFHGHGWLPEGIYTEYNTVYGFGGHPGALYFACNDWGNLWPKCQQHLSESNLLIPWFELDPENGDLTTVTKLNPTSIFCCLSYSLVI